MEGSTLIARQGGMVEAEVDGELVGLDVERGTCFGFNATATELWRLLEQPRTLDALCSALMEAHEVDADTCRRDVAAAVGTLADEGLVRLTPAS